LLDSALRIKDVESVSPASTRPSDKIEHFARLHRRKLVLHSRVVQSIHNALQDVERREAPHAAAIE
jgi:hypothetical protein